MKPLKAQWGESSAGPCLEVLDTHQGSCHGPSFLAFPSLVRVLLDLG